MKMAVDIPSGLLAEARELAAKEKTSLDALIAEGLRQVLAERQKPKQPSATSIR
jgi:NAD(P)H-hydrate repair Nnr-like enzyme with NAD(P)H-hydrate epimerase domain